MKNIICNLILTTIFITLFQGCTSVETVKSDDVEQRIIFQQYFIHYDAADSTTIAIAKFNVNNGAGTALKLVSGSYVKYNGEKLSGEADKNDNTYQYTLRRHEALESVNTFTYLNNDKQEFSNNVEINPFELQASQAELSKSDKNTLQFKGKPISENETIECVLTQQDNAENSYPLPCYQDNNNPQMIVIFGEDIDAPAGKYSMQFVRRNSSSEISAMDRGGLWETEYLSKTVNVTIAN